MNGLIRAAADLQAVCESHGWRYCFIGGLAVQRWGEPRETVDVDLTLLTGFTGEEHFVSVLMSASEARIEDAARCSTPDLLGRGPARPQDICRPAKGLARH